MDRKYKMSEGKILKQMHIQCNKCKLIVPYKKKYRRGLIVKTKKCDKCIRCNTDIDKSGKRYIM